MTDKKKETAAIADTIETMLEERKTRGDRRQEPEVRLPKGVERRSGKDRRSA